MAAKLLFVHGTGGRDVSGSLSEIRESAQRVLQWPPDRVVALEWGNAVGPADLDIRPALPPEYATRGLGDDLSEAEQSAAMWDLLLADPLAELRVIGAGGPKQGGIHIAADPPGVVLAQRLNAVDVPAETLEAAGVSPEELSSAASQLASAVELSAAADATGDADDPELVVAVARAVVALAAVARASTLADRRPQPRIAYDAAIREQLIGELADALAPGTRGLGGWLLGKVLAPIATKVAIAKRTDFMGPLSDFLRDIAFYIAHGDTVRTWLADAIRTESADDPDDGPVVVVAHSLGGIAMVDLLSDPAVMGTPEQPAPDRPKVDLLVTAGSQAPLLYLMDSLQTLRPGPPRAGAPFVPWLNVYNREDLLSFYAGGVWTGDDRIADKSVSAGVPFPASHSAYWVTDDVFEHIGQQLVRNGLR